ncbi:MAG: hypothetical protein GY779_02890 [Gammaproteobacteria bacterium]|nr:hypothetical protein [Gammaproteobacteria bacterium]
MLGGGEFSIVEGSGGFIAAVIAGVFLGAAALKSMMPDGSEEFNQQAQSANNALTDRSNKPRPYQRAFDIGGTVQSIPSNLMQTYSVYDSTNRQYQYGYYYICRGFVDTPEEGVLDGETPLSAMSGNSANIYDPFTSPNNSTPRQVIGSDIDEPLFIGVKSSSVDGTELKAPSEFSMSLASGLVTCQLVGSTGTLIDDTGSRLFDDLFSAGSNVQLVSVRSGLAVLSGEYVVSSSSATTISFDVTDNLEQWQKIEGGSAPMSSSSSAKISPANAEEAGYSDWSTISAIKPKRILANIVARQGMYRTPNSTGATNSASATAQLQWQRLDDSGNPVGVATTVSKTLKDKTRDEVGMSIIVNLSTPSAVRVRVRRSSSLDTSFHGSVVDVLTYKELYGQTEDEAPHYGDLTTIHTKRKATAQATSVKSPQLKVTATEMLYKYLGDGEFATARTPNAQAVQTLIRLMRDPVVGGLSMSAKSMDDLLAVQNEIEAYFGSAEAGQFCYTFDQQKTTPQEHCQIIAKAIFCNVDRTHNDIRLLFDKPSAGPAMVFTHRSKVGDEKWSRSFGKVDNDSVQFTWIDPKTNIRETVNIPEEGGAKPNKIESKGVRSKQQAYWLAHRARQRDILQRVAVDFTATEEGVYVNPGQAISVVKGSRIAAFDGYIVAQNGLSLTLSQEVAFTEGDDHFIQLKKRDGTVESVRVVTGANARTVTMLSLPAESIYTKNSALKTEFSFGNEARHLAQMIVPLTVDPQSDKSVKITGVNYHPDVYKFDQVQEGSSYSNGYSDGYAN